MTTKTTPIKRKSCIVELYENAYDDFYTNLQQPPEIIEGIIREGQILAFGGDYGVGKTPLLEDIITCVVRGIPWCGRKVSRRPVIALDFESAAPTYKLNLLRCAEQHQVADLDVPREADVYLSADDPKTPNTRALLDAFGRKPKERLNLISRALNDKRNALVVIDPPEVFLSLDTLKKTEVQSLYHELRHILSSYPHAAFWLTFNMRKKDRQGSRPRLLNEPRAWLEEVCGSLDLMNRADVRVGMDFLRDQDARVLNGVRRGEDMSPLIVRPIPINEREYAGFEAVSASDHELAQTLTAKQLSYWSALPDTFSYSQGVDRCKGKANFSRLSTLTTSLGMLTKTPSGEYVKKREPV